VRGHVRVDKNRTQSPSWKPRLTLFCPRRPAWRPRTTACHRSVTIHPLIWIYGFIIDVLSALAQTTRLEAFREVVRSEPQGLPAGEIARRLNVPQNTMSAHLAVLARTGLLIAERQSRSMIYRADLAMVRGLVLYLLRDCCAGRSELCAPVIEALAPCCAEGGACV
jgi:ArsR family transcriptional regulator